MSGKIKRTFKNSVVILILFLIVLSVGYYLWSKRMVVPRAEIEELTYEQVVGDELQNQDAVVAVFPSEEEPVTIPDLPPEEDLIVDLPADEIATAASDAQLPTEINLAVPFTSQAPSANWDLPYQEACEEASAYMVYLYYQGVPSGVIDPDQAEQAILEIVDFENDYLGYYLDTTAAETANIIDMFYGLSATIVDNPTIDEIKAELAAGRPVIVPAAGRQLGNPFFSGEGPLYHMLVLRGYTADGKFISNDPGTRNGNGYVYSQDVIMGAMGDWNDGDPANGVKRVIFVSP